MGGLDLLVHSEVEILPPEGEAYRSFISREGPAPGADTIPVRLTVTPFPRAEGQVIFESSAAWSLLEDGRRRTIVDRDDSGTIFSVLLEPESGEEVLVECSPRLVAAGSPPAVRSPVHYPVDQILAMYLLGRQGVLVHAAGMLVRGRGVLLPGVSGAGKTTFSRLAAGRPGWEPLSDDRILVRLPDGSGAAFAHGTPWPGDGRIATNKGGPLGHVVFLSQGSTNALEPLTPSQATRRLLAATTVPWYDREYVSLALEACDQLVGRVPASLLTFRPDQGAVDLVERLADESRTLDRQG